MMRTEEEAKYDLDESIFELYDQGMSITEISKQLDTASEYVVNVLKSASFEAT